MIDDASPTVNRREFLGLAPRHLLGEIRAVLNHAMAPVVMSAADHLSTARSDDHQGRAEWPIPCGLGIPSPPRWRRLHRTRWASGQQIAVLDPARCLAWSGSACQTCYLQCPLRDEAITLDDGRPLVMASACNGCGVCVEACRAVNDLGAIRLVRKPVSYAS